MATAMTVAQHVGKDGDTDLAAIFGAIAAAARQIERKIRLAGLSDTYGAVGAVNVQGEEQQKLDVFANDALIEALRGVACVAAAVSEEDEEPVLFDHDGARFAVIFDPLDGSSNIDVNVNVGTIFSIQQLAAGGDAQAAALQPGTAQVAAGYVVYGPSTVMVIALPGVEGVDGFTLNDGGEFVLSSASMTMPAQGPYYSANEANEAQWPAAYQQFAGTMRRGELGGKAYGARYIGSLVADFHRTLLKGGVFFYPPTAKAPKGKLRLLYEANPLALVAEQAGGAAVNGAERILELQPEAIHQRTPLVVGSRVEVEALQRAVRESQA